jgi:hypothetical protein
MSSFDNLLPLPTNQSTYPIVGDSEGNRFNTITDCQSVIGHYGNYLNLIIELADNKLVVVKLTNQCKVISID